MLTGHTQMLQNALHLFRLHNVDRVMQSVHDCLSVYFNENSLLVMAHLIVNLVGSLQYILIEDFSWQYISM